MAGLCGRLTLHRDLRTGLWEPDPQRSRRCLRDPQRVLEYCRQVGGTYGEGLGRRESGSKTPRGHPQEARLANGGGLETGEIQAGQGS